MIGGRARSLISSLLRWAPETAVASLLILGLCGCSGAGSTPELEATSAWYYRCVVLRRGNYAEATACVEVRETQAVKLAELRCTVEAQRVWGTRIPVLETRVAGSELDLATAVALATRCVAGPTAFPTSRPPLSTPQGHATETATPMPGVLCQACRSDVDCRPAGSGSTLFCRDCLGATGRRCVSRESPSGDCTTCRNILGLGVEEGGLGAPVVSLPEWIRNEAWKARGVPYNADAMFQRYAREQGLGAPNTREFDVDLGGVAYRVQGFDHGIVYVVIPRWGETAHLAW